MADRIADIIWRTKLLVAKLLIRAGTAFMDAGWSLRNKAAIDWDARKRFRSGEPS